MTFHTSQQNSDRSGSVNYVAIILISKDNDNEIMKTYADFYGIQLFYAHVSSASVRSHKNRNYS